jgi:hypothetical protein
MTSIIKVDNLQNQCGANIISESANVITIGASGDTVTLAAGASQSGFGRSGSVNWDTTPKTSSPVTAVSGNGYFINTTSIAITVNLPSTPAAGDIVAIADYNGTAGTNNITVGRNSSNINGDAADLLITKNYSAISFVYVDATAGWRSVDTSNVDNVQNPFIVATGGTITCDGDYRIHSFTGPGTFTVTNAGTPAGSNTVDYLVVASGGGGSGSFSGGGGAGGYRFSNGTASGCYSAGPAPLGAAALPVSVQGYPITVGAGGSPGPSACSPAGLAGSGNSSVFSTITSTGGGRGGVYTACAPSPGPAANGAPGGSGGGGGNYNANASTVGGTGNTPPVSPSQGNNGGTGNRNPSTHTTGGGGGGAGAVGGNATNPGPAASAGPGGAGLTSSITASPVARGGGGGGAGNVTTGGTGGPGGGGNGYSPSQATSSGSTNTGGGGGSGGTRAGGAGGSGIVVIRYKYQ